MFKDVLDLYEEEFRKGQYMLLDKLQHNYLLNEDDRMRFEHLEEILEAIDLFKMSDDVGDGRCQFCSVNHIPHLEEEVIATEIGKDINYNNVAVLDQEEYVWAMRTSAYEQRIREEEESEDKDDDPLIRKEKTIPDMILINKATILASFVPDQIILNVNDYTSKTFDACILCGDVSGFTELCETYNQIGSGGPSRLTDMLNNFIGAMVQEIMSHGGDVIKFSGDAFLALFRCSHSYTMRDYIQEAINCALIIQKSHNNFITDVGVTLRGFTSIGLDEEVVDGIACTKCEACGTCRCDCIIYQYLRKHMKHSFET